MEKSKKRLILFMPSIDGGGVEKNLIIISNYLSKKIDDIVLITFDSRFNNNFNKNIKIINAIKKQKKNIQNIINTLNVLFCFIRKLKEENHSYLLFKQIFIVA